MPISKRKGSPFYWYSFSIAGRRFRGSTGETEKSRAKEVERDQYQLAKQSLLVRTDWDLQSVLSTYWNEHAKDTASADDIEGHFADLQRLLGKTKKTSTLTNGDLMDYRAKRRGEKRRGRFPAANSINREFAYLRAAFEHCKRFHKQPMPDIDWKGLKAKEPPPRTRFLSKGEFTRMMEAADPRIRPIILCGVATGLRKENVLALDWEQVSLESRTITAKVKGNKEYSLRIAPALMAMLSTMSKRDGPVFDRTNFRRLWQDAKKAAGVTDFKFHDLRHTFASWARQAGADLADIKEALNHSSVEMTMRYAHVKPDEEVTPFDRVSRAVLTQSRTHSRKKRRK